MIMKLSRDPCWHAFERTITSSVPPPLPRQPLPGPHRVGKLLRDGRGECRIIAVRFKLAQAKAEHEGRQRDKAEEAVEGGGGHFSTLSR